MPALAQASSASPPGAPETPTAPSSEPAGFDRQPAADDDGAGQIADSGLHHPGLADGVEFGRAGAKAGRGPCLARSGRHRVRAREAVAQQDLRDAEAVNDGDRHLKAALSAIRQRCARQVERQFGAQRFVGYEGFLCGGRAGEQGRNRRCGQQISERSSSPSRSFVPRAAAGFLRSRTLPETAPASTILWLLRLEPVERMPIRR